MELLLIALNRLIGAWSVVMENMSDHEDKIFRFMITLVGIHRQVKTTFPLTKQFVWPGFDTSAPCIKDKYSFSNYLTSVVRKMILQEGKISPFPDFKNLA